MHRLDNLGTTELRDPNVDGLVSVLSCVSRHSCVSSRALPPARGVGPTRTPSRVADSGPSVHSTAWPWVDRGPWGSTLRGGVRLAPVACTCSRPIPTYNPNPPALTDPVTPKGLSILCATVRLREPLRKLSCRRLSFSDSH